MDDEIIVSEGNVHSGPNFCPMDTESIADKIVIFAEALSDVGLYSYQVVYARRIITSLLEHDGHVITALWSRQSGKCHAKGTPIMMADGSIQPVESIKVGDKLMGDDSTPRTVLSLARGREKMVRVQPIGDYADAYVVNQSHILSVKRRHLSSSYDKPRKRTWEVEDVCVADLLGKKALDSKVMGYKVPLEFDRHEVDLEPYWLGLWLGDVGQRDTRITTADQEVVDYLEEYAESVGCRLSEYAEAEDNNSSTFAIVSSDHGNPLRTALHKYNLLLNKHIPTEYKCNDRDTRLQLLAGIIDSDGSHAASAGKENVMEVTFKNKRLSEDTMWLLRSLGFRASMKPKPVNGTTYWRVCAYGDFSVVPTRLDRKQYSKSVLREDPLRYGFTLEELPTSNYYGFTLDGNKRYLLADFTVTHNTECIADIVLALAVLLPILADAFPDDYRFHSFRKGFRAGIYAPKKEQAEISFARMRQRAESTHGAAVMADPEINVYLVVSRGDTLTFSNGSRIMARTASEQSSVEGETHDLLICEESQKLLRSKVDKELRPMLAATNGTEVHIGTAWYSRGGFHNTITDNVEIYKNGGPRNHFEFSYELVIREKQAAYDATGNTFHLNYAKFVKSTLKKLGGNKDNEEFKMNFRCLWQETRGIALMPSVIKRAALWHQEVAPQRFGFHVAGLDVGKVTDSSVLTIADVDIENPMDISVHMPGANKDKTVAYMKTFIGWLEMLGSFEGDTGQYNQLVEFLMYFNVHILAIDASSMGDPVAEHIQTLVGDDIMVIPYKFHTSSKSYLYKYYLQEWNAGRIKYAAGPETRETFEYTQFIAQHTDLDKEEKNGYVTCRAPEGQHDDFPDSGALACWCEKYIDQQKMPELEVSTVQNFGTLKQQRHEPVTGSVEVSMVNSFTSVSRSDRYRCRS